MENYAYDASLMMLLWVPFQVPLNAFFVRSTLQSLLFCDYKLDAQFWIAYNLVPIDIVGPRLPTINIYLSGLLARRQNAWSQESGNMRVIANGTTADQYEDFVLVYRVMPRILIFQDKIQLQDVSKRFTLGKYLLN